jgi:CcmD family protein
MQMKEGLNFVMGVNLIIWCGIACYLFMLDRRIKKLEDTSGDKDR